jgi:diguanylate cyclase (GGDEF)-like protein/PAS domain S-box-containing protein
MGKPRAAQAAHPDDSVEADRLAASALRLSQTLERELRATIGRLEAQADLFETLLSCLPQGVCVFDADQRLVSFNRRYAEMYRLRPDQLPAGISLAEITELRRAVGTSPMKTGEYLAWQGTVLARMNKASLPIELLDGRTIQILHQPRPGGGWVAVHEEITGAQASRAVGSELLSIQGLIDWVPDNLWVKDAQSRFVLSNRATARRMGYESPEELIGKSDLDLLKGEDREGIAEKFFADEQRVVESGTAAVDIEEYVIDAAGGKRWISTTKVPLRNASGAVFGIVGISRDITERKLADAFRSGQAQILQMIAMSAPLEQVLERLVRLVESQLTGIAASVLLIDADGQHLRHGASSELAPDCLKACAMACGPQAGSCGTAVHRREPVIVSDIASDPLWEHHRRGALDQGYRSCWSTPILSHQGAVLGTFALWSSAARKPTETEAHFAEVATRLAGIAIERKLAEERIRFMATHDALTGLPNRLVLRDRLSQAIQHAKRHDRWLTVVFIDIDNFKLVNDSLGHGAGDELLKEVAGRMVATLRPVDTVVRLGGDEFVILLLDRPKDIEAIAADVQKIRAAIALPLNIGGRELRVTSSFGMANFPAGGEDADELLANADAAMYRAKELGRDNCQFYRPELSLAALERLRLQADMRDALARSELALVYQPQVDLRSGRVFGVEALLRWRHPELGLISPAKFIPIAEECGLIVSIGGWVLREACRQNKEWQKAGLPAMTVAVNVSARQFRHRDLVLAVQAALDETGLDPKYLELELTESLIMPDIDGALMVMRELQKHGVKLSIDDFGTGYSSLSLLKTLPVVRLKIDKSFIDDLGSNENDRAVASALISLGQKLGLRVIAEGVEKGEQIAFLREHGCDEMQGYYFSRPLPPIELQKLVGAELHCREGALAAVAE